MIYLDAAATTAVRREVLEAMWPWLAGAPGNPSSTHDLGRAAAEALAQARASVAEVLEVRASEVVFTSGGTEANNLAVKGITLASPRGRHVVTTAVEHPSVLESCDYLARFHGAQITVVGVDSTGLVDPDDVAAAVRHDTALVAVMYANNEVGAVQPLARIAELARGVPVYTDAVQAAGCLDLSLPALGAQALGLSGHKLGAPHGVGALAVRGAVPVEPLVHGGGQQRGRRSGTENVAAAVGLATALRLAPEVATGRDAFIADVLATVPGALLTGPRDQRLPGHASFCFPGTSGESLLLELEARGIVCSSGSACAAGSDEPSSVLTAMGISADLAQTAVRFTWGADVSADDLSETVAQLRAARERVASLGG